MTVIDELRTKPRIYVKSDAGWTCACGYFTTDIGWQAFIDKDSLLGLIMDEGQIPVDFDFNDLVSSTNLDTFSAAWCESCEDWSSDWNEETRYFCPGCGEYYDNPHDALVCCNESCPDDCNCLAGVNPFVSPLVGMIYQCSCHQDCQIMVCLVCHDSLTSIDRARTHWVQRHSDVKVETNSKPDCPMCTSEFCCLIHNAHKPEHQGCELA